MKRSTSPSVRRLVTLVVGAALGTLTLAPPAGAQQVVDAGKEGDGSGGLAFVLMTAMFFFIAFSLLFMDRIRRRAGDEERSE
jgi:hypothetical protein